MFAKYCTRIITVNFGQVYGVTLAWIIYPWIISSIMRMISYATQGNKVVIFKRGFLYTIKFYMLHVPLQVPMEICNANLSASVAFLFIQFAKGDSNPIQMIHKFIQGTWNFLHRSDISCTRRNHYTVYFNVCWHSLLFLFEYAQYLSTTQKSFHKKSGDFSWVLVLARR